MSDTDSTKSVTSRGAAVIGMLVAFIGGYLLGDLSGGRHGQAGATKAASAPRHGVPVGASPVKGAASAPVTIVEFADFQCGYCARSVPVQRRILDQFPGLVRWVYKHFPLPDRIHPQARMAARASLAAAAQGQFWEFHGRLFRNQQQLSPEDLVEHARALGLDAARFRKDLEDKALDKAIEDDVALARTLKVQGTPNFFINGRHFTGSISASRMERLVKEELSHAQQLVLKGVRPDQIYHELTSKPASTDKPAAVTEGQGAAAATGEGNAARLTRPVAPAPAREAP